MSPGLARQGNADLLPELRDYYSIIFSKAIKSNNFSLKLYSESIKDAIVDTYQINNQLLIKKLENAALNNFLGFNIGVRTKLFKKINTNFNTGLDYSNFKDKSPLALIKSNSGITFRGNINVSTKIFKDKVNIAFSGNQRGPIYSLASKTITNPYLDFRINTNLLKDRLRLGLYYGDILNTGTNRTEYAKAQILVKNFHL